MSDFINTIDLLGDDVVVDSIIDRSITEFKDDRVTEVGESAFSDCDKLETVELPNVTRLGTSTFNGCSALMNVSTPLVNGNLENGVFNGCKSLVSVDLPLVTGAGQSAFNGLESVVSVNLPMAKSIGLYGFNEANALVSIELPEVTAAATVFQYCAKLEHSYMPKCKSLTGYWSFAYTPSLKLLDLPALTEIGGTGMFTNGGITSLVLRNPDLVRMVQSTPFVGTPIASGTGYIYVPRALLSDEDETKDYRRATNWSVHAAQFRALEDYTVDGTTTGELDESKI